MLCQQIRALITTADAAETRIAFHCPTEATCADVNRAISDTDIAATVSIIA